MNKITINGKEVSVKKFVQGFGEFIRKQFFSESYSNEMKDQLELYLSTYTVEETKK